MKISTRQRHIIDQLLIEEKKATQKEVAEMLNEDYARGIPNAALETIASETSESLKRCLAMHIQAVATDPKKQRDMYISANKILRLLEKDIKEKLENRLQDFLRTV